MDDDLLYMQNRELSWLKFNTRVLEEAISEANPLLERLKFASIFTSNLDEFFMIRVGSLTDIAHFNPTYQDNKTGMLPQRQLDLIYKDCIHLYKMRNHALHLINRNLSDFGIQQKRIEDLRKSERKELEVIFLSQILPFLSPQIIDSRHPFPHLDNKHLHVATTLESKDHELFGLIPIPKSMERLFFLKDHSLIFLLIEDIILYFAHHVFETYTVREKTVIAVTRNADIDADAGFYDEEIDYMTHMKNLIQKRKRLSPVRLELQNDVSAKFLKYFCKKFKLNQEQIFISESPLDLSYVFALEDRIPSVVKRELCFPAFTPALLYNVSESSNMMQEVEKKDFLLSYPYESMQPFLKLINEAAHDVHTVSIKITLYRIDKQSKLAESLIYAAENGKDITVIIELRARFDEQNNIEWSQRLEEAGCRVIYGTGGYKVHSKICLITRHTKNNIQYITQIGTGNYNEKTSKIYTDLSLITANQEIGRDAMNFFRHMSVGNLNGEYVCLWVAPNFFECNILAGIDGEIAKAKNGGSGEIIFKINSLTEKVIVEKLMEASCSGVKIKLIVRGICCIIPGIAGQTENIEVISIVGRFLEHSRIYCFGNDVDQRIYIASADLMTRNMKRRVEIACPLMDSSLKTKVYGLLTVMLKDNVKARQQNADGTYSYVPSEDATAVNSQEFFMKQAQKDAQAKFSTHTIPIKTDRFKKFLRIFFKKA